MKDNKMENVLLFEELENLEQVETLGDGWFVIGAVCIVGGYIGICAT